jgi:choline transport protein
MIAVWVFTMFMIASMGDLASMAPTPGGQYHFISEFAPRPMQKPLSYIVGWLCCLGWVAGVPACGLQLAGIIQEMVNLTYPEAGYDLAWQATLTVSLFVILTVGFNMFFAQHLPLAEGVVLFLHVFGFFAFLLTFWIMANHAPAKDVFTNFKQACPGRTQTRRPSLISSSNGGGWSSTGLSCLVGLSSPMWCFIGPDSGAHMSEELKDASITLPKAMLYGNAIENEDLFHLLTRHRWATFANGIMGITMIITFWYVRRYAAHKSKLRTLTRRSFCITDLEDVLAADTDYPIIQIIY